MALTDDATPAQANQNVISALRLAVVATDDYEKLGRVTEAILKEAPETPATNTGGVELLVAMHKAGSIKFEVSGDV